MTHFTFLDIERLLARHPSIWINIGGKYYQYNDNILIIKKRRDKYGVLEIKCNLATSVATTYLDRISKFIERRHIIALRQGVNSDQSVCVDFVHASGVSRHMLMELEILGLIRHISPTVIVNQRLDLLNSPLNMYPKTFPTCEDSTSLLAAYLQSGQQFIVEFVFGSAHPFIEQSRLRAKFPAADVIWLPYNVGTSLAKTTELLVDARITGKSVIIISSLVSQELCRAVHYCSTLCRQTSYPPLISALLSFIFIVGNINPLFDRHILIAEYYEEFQIDQHIIDTLCDITKDPLRSDTDNGLLRTAFENMPSVELVIDRLHQRDGLVQCKWLCDIIQTDFSLTHSRVLTLEGDESTFRKFIKVRLSYLRDCYENLITFKYRIGELQTPRLATKNSRYKINKFSSVERVLRYAEQFLRNVTTRLVTAGALEMFSRDGLIQIRRNVFGDTFHCHVLWSTLETPKELRSSVQYMGNFYSSPALPSYPRLLRLPNEARVVYFNATKKSKDGLCKLQALFDVPEKKFTCYTHHDPAYLTVQLNLPISQPYFFCHTTNVHFVDASFESLYQAMLHLNEVQQLILTLFLRTNVNFPPDCCTLAQAYRPELSWPIFKLYFDELVAHNLISKRRKPAHLFIIVEPIDLFLTYEPSIKCEELPSIKREIESIKSVVIKEEPVTDIIGLSEVYALLEQHGAPISLQFAMDHLSCSLDALRNCTNKYDGVKPLVIKNYQILFPRSVLTFCRKYFTDKKQ